LIDQADRLRALANSALARIDQIASGQISARAPGRVITVTSGKGGVGKTFVSVNLATAMARRGMRVLLFDADFGLSNVNVQLGLTPLFDLGHYARGQAPLEKVICPVEDRLHVLSGGSGLTELVTAGPGLVSQVISEISSLRRRYDAVIIDTGAGLSGIVQRFLLSAEEILLVTTEEPAAITDAYAVLKCLSLKGHGGPVMIAVNMADEQSARRAYNALKSATSSFLGGTPEVEFLCAIPRDAAVRGSVIAQQALFDRAPDCKASRSIMTLCSAVVARGGEAYGEHAEA
jgi:flagellar biosynthesis protein FlhG